MSLFSKRGDKPRFKVLEVEDNPDRVLAKIKDFLIQNSPALMWSPRLAQVIGWKVLEIKPGAKELRGQATYYSGKVDLRLNGSLKWMAPGGFSELNGQEDLTPVGVLAHELGHHYHWAVKRHLGKTGERLDEEYAAIGTRSAISDYGRTDTGEDFAEAYRLFLLNPKLLSRLSPPRYTWFLTADKHLKDETGFEHGILRPPGNINFVRNRLEEMLVAGQSEDSHEDD